MDAGILDRVRGGCRKVAERAAHVRIVRDRIPAYAIALAREPLTTPVIDPTCHYLGHGHDTTAFFLTLDAINFGSGYFPHLRKREGMSGYFTVAAALNDHFRAHGPIQPGRLAEITGGECAAIFGQDPDNAVARELMGLFAAALNGLGRSLLERFSGSFTGLVEEAGASAERLALLLAGIPYFNDVASYGGLEVVFLKRAQITAADLFLAFSGKGPGRFLDMDRLTVFADNLVPHVLRVDGILNYDEGLAAAIAGGEEIAAGSAAEVELRACAVHAAELLVGEVSRIGPRINAMQLDQFLWNRGQGPLFKALPRHRTRTVFY